MNVLTIGTSKSFLNEKENSPSNTIERHKLISEGISKLSVAILVNEDEYNELDVTDKINVHQIPFKNFLSIPKAFNLCSKICIEKNVDVISAQSPFFPGMIGFMLKIKYKIPLNIQIHGDFIDNSWWIKQRKTHFLWNKWAKWVLKRSDTIRTVNSEIKKQIMSIGLNENKIIDFPVFLDITKFLANSNDLRAKFKDFKYIILFVGFLSPIKGVDVLLNAASLVLEKYPETLFLIVGDGEEMENLKEISKKLQVNKNVVFEGNVSHENISSYFKTCDIFVLPSRSEGWPRVVLEALVSQKPAVISDACSITKFLDKEKCGLSFKVDNPISLAKKLLCLIENRKLAKKMGKKGKKIVIEKYSKPVILPKYNDLWIKTIEEAKK